MIDFDTLRPFIAKFIAPFIGLAITYLNKRYGMEFNDNDAAQAIASLVDLVVFSIATGVSAVTINKKVNPGNAASSHLAAVEKTEAAVAKFNEDTREHMIRSQK